MLETSVDLIASDATLQFDQPQVHPATKPVHTEHVTFTQAWPLDCIEGDCEHRNEFGEPEDLSACPNTPMEVCVQCMVNLGAGSDPRGWEETLLSWPCQKSNPIAPSAASEAPLSAVAIDWHFGRAFKGTQLEDHCPCEKEACGLVTRTAAEGADCPEHGMAAGKTIRQSHRADRCPELSS